MTKKGKAKCNSKKSKTRKMFQTSRHAMQAYKGCAFIFSTFLKFKKKTYFFK